MRCDSDVEGSAEIESDVGNGSEAIKIAKPTMGAAAGGVAGEGGIDIAIGEDEVVALEQGHDLALAAVGEIGGVQKRESGGSEEALLFAATRGGLNEGRRVPLGEMETVAADFEPAFEEIELGAFARAVSTFDDDESAGIGAAGNRTTWLRESGFGGLGARCPWSGGVLSVHEVAKARPILVIETRM